MKKKTIAIGIASAIAAVALLVWAFAPRPVEVEVAQVTTGQFETTIDEDARTRLHDRFVVSAPLAGRLQRLSLREGDAVQAGDVIAQILPILSPLMDQRSLGEQRARVGMTEAGVRRADTLIGAARIALEQTRMALDRTEKLARQGFVSPTTVDNDRLAFQAAQKELENATQTKAMAVYELAQARAALGVVRSEAGGKAFAVKAPVSGRVLKIHHASEATLSLGAPIIDIGDTAKLEIVAELLSTDALLALPGSAVRIERWGGPQVLQGTVRRTEPAAFTKVSALGVEEQRVNVVIDLTSPREQWAALGDGFRVSVKIVTQSVNGVLRAPVSAVFPSIAAQRDGKTGYAVFVLDAGKARLQEVVVRDRSANHAWITQGLAQGDRVIIYPPATISDGARVKERAV